MKILQIHNHYRFGGGENFMFEEISRILRQKGHNVCIFERNSKYVQGLWGKICAFTEGIYSYPAKKNLSAIIMSEHPDIVHIHNVYPLISPSVLVACRQLKIPVVTTLQNYRLICPTGTFFYGCEICERCQDGKEYWCILKNCRSNIFESIAYAFRNVIARKLRLFLDNVTLYVPCSRFTKNKLVDSGLPEERVVVIPNIFSSTESVVKDSCGKYIVYSGRISPEKGIETLMVCARKTGLPLRLAGDYSQMPDIVKNKPQNAQFLGHLNHDQLSEFYQNARFSVVPSIWFEPFGIVIVEAMFHGLPVIASRIGGIPEIVEDGVTGFLFEPGNTIELEEKMKLLWNNPDLCRQMGKAGREKAIREYSEDIYYERLMSVYQKAIEINKEKRK